MQRLRAQFGDAILSRTQVYGRHRSFTSGREKPLKTHHIRDVRERVSPSKTFEQLTELIKGNRRLTVSVIVAISVGSTHSIINDELGRTQNCTTAGLLKASDSLPDRKGRISSPVMRRGSIITHRKLSRRVWSGENREKLNRSKQKSVSLPAKFLPRCFGTSVELCYRIFYTTEGPLMRTIIVNFWARPKIGTDQSGTFCCCTTT